MLRREGVGAVRHASRPAIAAAAAFFAGSVLLSGSTPVLSALTAMLVVSVTVVDVLVPADKAPELAARSATGKVAIVLDARER